MKVSGESAI